MIESDLCILLMFGSLFAGSAFNDLAKVHTNRDKVKQFLDLAPIVRTFKFKVPESAEISAPSTSSMSSKLLVIVK
jgi:hypothetical protein